MFDVLGQENFDKFVEASLPTILRNGCFQALIGLFNLKGQEGDPRNNFFNKVFFELLTFEKNSDFTITKADI